MRRFLQSASLILILLVGYASQTFAQACDPTPFAHILRFSTVVMESHCSGTAIGPYALLTASHCEAPSDLVLVDDTVYRIIGTPARDNFDHSIFFLAMPKPFAHYAPFKPVAPKLGEGASLLGNPGPIMSFLRTGIFSGQRMDEDNNINWMFSFSAGEGDSGGGIFDTACKITAVMSFIVNAGSDDSPLWVSSAYPFKFTKEQYARIDTFKPDPKDVPKPQKLVPLAIIHGAVKE